MKRSKVGYAKLGRSMPLSLKNCGYLGGDVEMVPPIKALAERHPDVEFVLIGRNSGEAPTDVGLPSNVTNPWLRYGWATKTRKLINDARLNYPNLSVDDHRRVADILFSVVGGEFLDLDGMVMWLGQHGTTNTPLPKIEDRNVPTKPYDWATLYGSYLLHGINTWRSVDPLNREEVLLNADPRNYIKYRDSMWPWQHPVLAQYNYITNVKHERYGLDTEGFAEFAAVKDDVSWIGDGNLWTSQVRNVYSRLEVNALVPGTPFGDLISFNDEFEERRHFGLFINEARRQVNPARTRLRVLKDWVLPAQPAFIHGTWSKESLQRIDRDIVPADWSDYFPRLHSVLCTFTTPSSGSGWATTKPWEAFAAGTVCFFHPDYDTQDNILGDAEPGLRRWLRVRDPQELREKIQSMCQSPGVWRDIVHAQRVHFDAAISELRYLKMIEERLGL